jgi:hypothetical protein
MQFNHKINNNKVNYLINLDLFKTIVSPQFQRILDSLLIEDPNKRMKISDFKLMLTKLS